MERTNTMNTLDIMKHPAAYVSGYENTPTEEQNRAKQLCWSTTAPLPTNRKSGAVSCKVIRPITEKDKFKPEDILF